MPSATLSSSSVVRETVDGVFRVTIHDSAAAFRLQLQGDLTGRWVREAELCWRTGASTIGSRDFVVDVGGINIADSEGKRLLAKMFDTGARLTASTPETRRLVAEITGHEPVEVAIVQPGKGFFSLLRSFFFWLPCCSSRGAA